MEFGVVGDGISIFTALVSLRHKLKLLRITSLSHDFLSYTLSFGRSLSASEQLDLLSDDVDADAG